MIDRNVFTVDKRSAPVSTGIPIEVPIPLNFEGKGSWVMVFNPSYTLNVNIYPSPKTGNNPIVVPPRKWRQIGFFPPGSTLFMRSSGAAISNVELWHNPNKWDPSWQNEDLHPLASGMFFWDGVEINNVTYVGTAYCIDLVPLTDLGHYARKFTVLEPTNLIRIYVQLAGESAAQDGSTVYKHWLEVPANIPYTWPVDNIDIARIIIRHDTDNTAFNPYVTII